MKKLLALVLALVMSMSLVTISNAAFKDADKIDYKEAVDVMNAVGVFVGDEKGNFNAKENLTREPAPRLLTPSRAALPLPTWPPLAGPPALSATARRPASSTVSATASSTPPVS